MDHEILSGEWMWHPEWSEEIIGSAGAFVHFRRRIDLDVLPTTPIQLQITADTRYKLYVNSQLVSYGPVKGDSDLWFYDLVDIHPYLTLGCNDIAVRVLRLFHATSFATSFPRLQYPGLCVKMSQNFECSETTHAEVWETALDSTTLLPTTMEEDDFLHVYEQVDNSRDISFQWCPVRRLDFPASHGLTPPWKLSPRMIPTPKSKPAHFKAIHNVCSTLPKSDWERVLLHTRYDPSKPTISLPAGTSHYLEVEASSHLTAFLRFCFKRPDESSSILKITYSECYENAPMQIPYLRSKQDRCDTSKHLFGPQDTYVFGGNKARVKAAELKYDHSEEEAEIFAPFHYRTLRFVTLEIHVDNRAGLVLQGIEMISINYPLDLKATVDVQIEAITDAMQSLYRQIWDTSIRTLENCMHDCYEDCPFYEQLQYAMDTRSSILFTYSVSGDDRLARQAIVQLHNSYRPSLGLTASRAPSHQRQHIPHFSLFWVMMVADHFEHFADSVFVRSFTPACDGVLEHFARRIDPSTGLVRALPSTSECWDFVDWTATWRPMGIPPAAARTGYCSYTSMLYAYTLKLAATMLVGIQRPALAVEYRERADLVIRALRKHCLKGQFFTDGLSTVASSSDDYSQHAQIWAVLCGATTGNEAQNVLQQALIGTTIQVGTQTKPNNTPISFTPASTAMSFYTLRALSLADGNLYNEHFHSFWKPWKSQLELNLVTWEEDSISQRSDCHAWGCAALYEFTREIAGISPAEPGWRVLRFRPRLTLFSAASIKIPFGLFYQQETDTRAGCAPGIAHVKWHTKENGDIECSLLLCMATKAGEPSTSFVKAPPAQILLPGHAEELIQDSSNEIVRVVKKLR